MRFNPEFLNLESQQGKTSADSVMASRDAFQAKDKTGTSLFLFRDTEDIDVEIDHKISLVKDSERHLFRAKNSKEDLKTLQLFENKNTNLKIC